jgi:hypothetical protein
MKQRSVRNGGGPGTRTLLVFLAFAGIALFFLLSEHRVHALGWLPLLLLLACPFLHMFMHGGHRGSGGHGGHGGHGPARGEQAIDAAPAQARERI